MTSYWIPTLLKLGLDQYNTIIVLLLFFYVFFSPLTIFLLIYKFLALSVKGGKLNFEEFCWVTLEYYAIKMTIKWPN